MSKLKLPKYPHKGMTVYCHRCKRDNPKCDHFDVHKYKIRVHVSGTVNNKVTRVLSSTEYGEAVKEAIDFKNEVEQNNFQKVVKTVKGNDYSVADAVIKYNQYLSGEHEYAQHNKSVTDEHKKECIRFCRYFCKTLKGVKDVTRTRIIDIDKTDVARFYKWAENHYGDKTFNKCLNALKSFFNFLIDVEEIDMKNPFRAYITKHVVKKNIVTLSKEEFTAILNSVGTANPYMLLGGRGERKNMFKPYLVDGFKLFLLTGCRREEVVELRWCDILITIEGTKFFEIGNRKVNRKRHTDRYIKYIPINEDLFQLLTEMGFQEKKNSYEYILYPERNVKSETIMSNISKAFTHYVKEAGIKKDVSLMNLRKTYITWVNRSMGKQTGLLTSHSGEQVLKDHYIDSTILTAIEEAVLKVRVFGT